MKPFIFKQHELIVFCDHAEKKQKDWKDNNKDFFEKNQRFALPTEFYIFLQHIKSQILSCYAFFTKKKKKENLNPAYKVDSAEAEDLEDDSDIIRDLSIKKWDDLVEKTKIVMREYYDISSLIKLGDRITKN